MTNKISSGKFLLCLASGICLILLTVTVCVSLIKVSPDQQINSGVVAIISMLTTIFASIVTHYFTKKDDRDNAISADPTNN